MRTVGFIYSDEAILALFVLGRTYRDLGAKTYLVVRLGCRFHYHSGGDTRFQLTQPRGQGGLLLPSRRRVLLIIKMRALGQAATQFFA